MRKIFATAFSAGVVGCSQVIAQFNFMGFEGGYVPNIPYATDVGIPAGTPVNTPFTYTFVTGNNIQSFQNNSGGRIADTDDIGFSGAGSTSVVPDYHKAPSFGWQLKGWQNASNTAPNWGTYNYTFRGNGAVFNNDGEDYPGEPSPRNEELSEAININYLWSSTGNMYKAPGLGDYFLDAHGTHVTGGSYSSHLSVEFTVGMTDSYFMTLAFGGRDKGTAGGGTHDSVNFKGYYRLITNTGDVIFSGDTSQTPFEAWKPDPTDPTNKLKAVAATPVANNGVIWQNWEYYKPTFTGVAGMHYRLEILMPDELNFDFALGSNYNNVVSLVELVPVPEPATYGLMGTAGLVGLVVLRRRARARR